MHKAILMILLAVVSSSAVAEWVQFGGNETITIYVDPATIHKAGNMVKMWFLYDRRKADTHSARSRSCGASRRRTHYFFSQSLAIRNSV